MPGRVDLNSFSVVNDFLPQSHLKLVAPSISSPRKRTNDVDEHDVAGDEIAQRKRARVSETTSKPKPKSKPREKKFVCDYPNCSKKFTRPVQLEQHKYTHTGERPFVCREDPEKCNKAFSRQEHLRVHVKAQHLNEKTKICTYRIEVGKEEERGQFGWKRARPASDGSDLESGADGKRVCGARFSTNQHLKRHLESHLKEFPYVCSGYPPCNEGFRKKGPLARHIRTVHKGLNAWACSHKDIDDRTKMCEASFETKGKLGNHIESIHYGQPKRRFVCTLCVEPKAVELEPGKVIAPSVSKDENSSRSPSFPITKHNSAAKGPGFRTHKDFRAHMKEFHPPTCTDCGYVSKSDRSLLSHIQKHHEPTLDILVPSFPCPSCHKAFTRKSNLKTHIDSVHKKLYKFSCDVPGCSSRFKHKVALTYHRNVSAAHNVRPKKEKKKRKNLTKGLGIVEKITGVGYEDSGRDIECVIEGCQWRFCRMVALKVHLGAENGHRLEKEQVEELMLDTFAEISGRDDSETECETSAVETEVTEYEEEDYAEEEDEEDEEDEEN